MSKRKRKQKESNISADEVESRPHKIGSKSNDVNNVNGINLEIIAPRNKEGNKKRKGKSPQQDVSGDLTPVHYPESISKRRKQETLKGDEIANTQENIEQGGNVTNKQQTTNKPTNKHTGEESVSESTSPSNNRRKKGHKLPRQGLKEDGSDIYKPTITLEYAEQQQQKLDSALNVWVEAVQWERSQKLKSLAVAEWHSDVHLAEVTQAKGKHLSVMGFSRSSKLFLYPEEATYLADQGNMEIFHKGLSLSLQETYDLMMKSRISLEQYLSYAYLRRLGYIVRRYADAKHSTTPTATINNLQQTTNNNNAINNNKDKGSSSAKKLPVNHTPPQSIVNAITTTDITLSNSTTTSATPSNLLPSQSTSPFQNSTTYAQHILTTSTSLPITPPSIPRTNTSPEILSPCLSSNTQDPVPTPLLTTTVTTGCQYKCRAWYPSEVDFMKIDISTASAYEVIHKHPPLFQSPFSDSGASILLDDAISPSADATKPGPSKPYSSRPREYKEGEISPLVDPAALGVPWHSPALLPKLQIFRSRSLLDVITATSDQPDLKISKYKPFLDPAKTEIGGANNDVFEIMYDVYKPSPSWKKTAPGDPDFRVCVCKSDDSPPAIRQLQILVSKSHPIPLKFCIVSNGNVNFIGFLDRQKKKGER